jgi:crotonobetainyl-CoA:carnitine CoA-transferase CaiB-like acyl-CoA transferase
MATLPLKGVRIVDLCLFLAGPYATSLLASLGAEVIKVESIQRLDYLRLMGGYPQPDGYEWSPAFNSVNVDKYGVTLDLNNTRGIEILKKLVEVSDVVANNFSSRVMENWGLSYEALRDINPRIITLSMPGYGTSGPWRNYVSMGPNVEMLAGIPTISGYPAGPPMLQGYIADPFAGLAGAIAVMVALKHRQRTGKGQNIDLSQVEAVTSFMGQPIMDYVMNGRIRPRIGNRHPSVSPQGVYRCSGEDEWIAIAVSSEQEWASLCEVMGDPSWTKERRFSEPSSRHANHEALDRLIEEWTCHLDKHDASQVLQQAGIAAAPVMRCSEIISDPHIDARGFCEEVTHPVTGTQRYHGFPVKFSATPVTIRMPAPTLGQHNHYVLREILGIAEEEVRELVEEGVIGTMPKGWPYLVEGSGEGDSDKKLLVADHGSGVAEALEKRRGASAGDADAGTRT